MKIFITGGTGFIGGRLIEKLVADNHDVVLLIRDSGKADNLKNKKVTFIAGDLFDRDSLKKGMAGCDWVFHMAAFTKPWSKDPAMGIQSAIMFILMMLLKVKFLLLCTGARVNAISLVGKIFHLMNYSVLSVKQQGEKENA